MRTRVEQLAVRAGPDLVNDSGLQKASQDQHFLCVPGLGWEPDREQTG